MTVASQTTGTPCAFKGCRGFFHPGTAATGVILCASWGLEELSARSAWQDLAEALAAAGYPSLRFDYPGTGASLGTAVDIAQWTEATRAAAGFLQAYSGVKRLVLIGHSLGAAIAMTALPHLPSVETLVLIAPVASGTPYVRALRTLAGSAALEKSAGPKDELSLAGFTMSSSMVSSLEALEPLKGEPVRLSQAVVFERSGRKAGAQVSEHFKRLGIAASLEIIPPVTAGTAFKPFPLAIETIVDTLVKCHPPGQTLAAPRLPLLPATLRAATFREEPLVLPQAASGPQAMFCHPAQPSPGAPLYVVLGEAWPALGPWVALTRALAGHGLTSLRLTARDPHPATVTETLRLALEALALRGSGTIVLVATGEAAATALENARGLRLDGLRITDVIAIDPSGLGAAPNGQPGMASLSAFAMGLGGPAPVPMRPGDEKILFFQDLVKAADAARQPGLRAKVKAAAARFAGTLPCPVLLRALLLRDPRPAAAKALFAALARQGTAVSLVCSGAPAALEDLARYSGRNGRRLARHGVTILSLPGDGAQAGTWLVRHLAAIAGPEAASEHGRQAAA